LALGIGPSAIEAAAEISITLPISAGGVARDSAPRRGMEEKGLGVKLAP